MLASWVRVRRCCWLTTRRGGLDVLSAESIRNLLLERRNAGAATVLVSEDLDELLALSDRLLVIYRGRVAGEFAAKGASAQEIGLLMTSHA